MPMMRGQDLGYGSFQGESEDNPYFPIKSSLSDLGVHMSFGVNCVKTLLGLMSTPGLCHVFIRLNLHLRGLCGLNPPPSPCSETSSRLGSRPVADSVGAGAHWFPPRRPLDGDPGASKIKGIDPGQISGHDVQGDPLVGSQGRAWDH